MPIKKPHGYDYSLMPFQNRAIINKKKEEERRGKKSEQEKRDITLGFSHLLPVKKLFDEAGIPTPNEINEVETVGDLLAFLGRNRKLLMSHGIKKKDINKVQGEVARLRLAEIIETLGLKKLGAEKIIPLYSLLINRKLNKEAEQLYNMFDNISRDKNLLLGRHSL